MSSRELAEIIGHSASNLSKRLKKLTFNHKGKTCNVFGYFTSDNKQRAYLINPVILRRNDFIGNVDFDRAHKDIEILFTALANSKAENEGAV
jgi:hypothetical protein